MSVAASESLSRRLKHVARHYGDLGFTSFGGPGVHVVLLRQRFVEKLRWVDEVTFLDLFALGNALPGPGSTQLAFSIAAVKYGVIPALLAFLLWSLPGALGMAGIGIAISRIPDELPELVLAFFTGLNAAAVGLIAVAAVQLGTAASTDVITTCLVWLSASFGICYHAPWMYPTLIASGGLVTLLWDRRRQWFVQPWLRVAGSNRAPTARTEDVMLDSIAPTDGTATPATTPLDLTRSSERLHRAPEQDQSLGAPGDTTSVRRRGIVVQSDAEAVEDATPVVGHVQRTVLNVVSTRVAAALVGGFVLLLIVPLATRAGLSNAEKSVPRGLDFFANIILAGTIIFGGGPVVIPLLRDYVVVPGWVSSRDFLLVFSILQAFPGPNFNFAVALGFLACPGYRPLGAILGYIGIFSPGILLKIGLLPFYASVREKPIVRSVIRGLNAAASGLVFSAVWQLFLVGYVYQSPDGQGIDGQTFSGPLTSDPFWAVVSSGAYVGCKMFNIPPWAAIPMGGLAGMAWYGVQLR